MQKNGNSLSGRKPGRPIGCLAAYFLLLAVFLVFWIWRPFSEDSDARSISYSSFQQQVRQGNVSRVVIEGSSITGTLKEPVSQRASDGESADYTRFTTYLPSFADERLLGELESQGVEITAKPESGSSWLLFTNLLPVIVMVAFFLILFRAASRFAQSRSQGIFGMGRSTARAYTRSTEPTSFSDVAGLEGAKTELKEIVDFLKNPRQFQALGGQIPRGVLLLGPPGTGKTLLARAVAGEAGVPFFSITGSDFMEMLVGVGASRVRDLFQEAKKNAPAIIFIDELDSIGRRRGTGVGGGHDEREQTLNQLLSEMDGFERTQSVILMAATNRADVLDPALLRPGRFDRRVSVDLPTTSERKEILLIHSRNKPLSREVDLGKLARTTPGFSGADLANLLNEAALLAARRAKQSIEETDIEEARDKMILGLARKSLVLTENERRILAYHEAGHAIVAATVAGDPVHKVTIVPRGHSMGATQQLPEQDRYIYSREYLLNRLAVMMGGRASEELVCETASSGAEDDLRQATRLARKMVQDWGMSKRFPNISFGSGRDEIFLGEELGHRQDYSEWTAREIDQEIRDILTEAYRKAQAVLTDRHDVLDRMSRLLLEREALSGEEIRSIVSPGRQGETKGGQRGLPITAAAQLGESDGDLVPNTSITKEV